jgi:hypothetical protein
MRPTSGLEVATQLQVTHDAGVVVAILPDGIEEVTSREVPILDAHDQRMHLVEMHTGPWGIRAVDLISPYEEDVKWWRVKEAARQESVDVIPIRWEGPIAEIPSKYFEEGVVLAVRFYQHGPWFWPLEQPRFEKEEAINAAIEEALSDG